jgi:hypothetical protein
MRRNINVDDWPKWNTHEKWVYLAAGMQGIQDSDGTFALRRRLNPHHPIENQRQEARAHVISQMGRLNDLKDLYASARDELANTCDNDMFVQWRNILERLFTMDVDAALHKIIDEPTK